MIFIIYSERKETKEVLTSYEDVKIKWKVYFEKLLNKEFSNKKVGMVVLIK